MNDFQYRTYRTSPAAPRAKRPPLSLFRRTATDARTREIARAAAIEVLG